MVSLESEKIEESKNTHHVRKLKKIDHSFSEAKEFNATCHTWFIVKDKGVGINWAKPLL